jgi:hypothetical protein
MEGRDKKTSDKGNKQSDKREKSSDKVSEKNEKSDKTSKLPKNKHFFVVAGTFYLY